jgi:hypothetical protein
MMQKRLAKEKTTLAPYTLEEEEGNCWKLRNTNNMLVQFTFPTTYPFHPPQIKILEPVGILPRLGICGCSNGILCISGFLGDWGATWTVKRVMEHLDEILLPK